MLGLGLRRRLGCGYRCTHGHSYRHRLRSCRVLMLKLRLGPVIRGEDGNSIRVPDDNLNTSKQCGGQLLHKHSADLSD